MTRVKQENSKMYNPEPVLNVKQENLAQLDQKHALNV